MATKSGQTRTATALYMEEMLRELRTMGQQMDCDFLVYLLEMAAMEASDIANGAGSKSRQASYVVDKPQTLSAEELSQKFFEGAYD